MAIFLTGERASTLKNFFALILILYFWDYKNYIKKYIISAIIIITFLISLSPKIKQSEFFKDDVIHKYVATTLKIISLDQDKSFKQNLMASRYLNQVCLVMKFLKIMFFLVLEIKIILKLVEST